MKITATKFMATAIAFALCNNGHAASWVLTKSGSLQPATAAAKSLAFCTANPNVALAFTENVSATPNGTVREDAGPIQLQARINVDAVCLPGTSDIRIRYGVLAGSSAIPGDDFTPVSVLVATGSLPQYTPAAVFTGSGNLNLVNDTAQEGDETLQIGIINGEIINNDPNSGSILITIQAATDPSVTLTIQDDDDLNPTRFSTVLGGAAAGDPVAAAAIGPLAATCAAEAALPPAQQNIQLIAQCRAILANPQNAIAALRAISGEEFSSQITSSQDSANFVNQGVNGRLAALRGAYKNSVEDIAMSYNGQQIPVGALTGAVASIFGLSANEEPSAEGGLFDNRLGLFFTGTARRGDRTNRGFEVGFGYEGFQALGGVDYRFNDQFVGGLALGYGKIDTDLSLNAGYLDTKAVSGTVYSSYFPADRWYVDLALGILRNDYDQGRVIDLSSLGASFGRTIATGSTSGRQSSFSTSLGYAFGSGATSISPNLRLSYAKTTIDGFTETGGGINDLIYPDQDFKSFQVSLGLNMSHAISLESGVLQPYANFDFSREQKNDAFNFNPVLRIRPNQISTPLFISESDRSFGRGELGVLYVLPGGWQISASYSEILGYRDLSARSFSLTGRFEF